MNLFEYLELNNLTIDELSDAEVRALIEGNEPEEILSAEERKELEQF